MGTLQLQVTKESADKGELMNTRNELLGIQFNIEKAKRTDGKVQNLASYLNKEVLISIHKQMEAKKAVGVDGVSKEKYGENLEENLEQLIKRMKSGSYKPKPMKRVYIEKTGSKNLRPLGISCYEDKLVEHAIAQILSQIYEHKFYEVSYGFRPNRNCHQAVKEVIDRVQRNRTGYVVEADIKSFFDELNHDWLIKFLEHDIADKKFIELIKKLLNAGIMEQGNYIEREKGSAQGNGASPVLANIYLHYVLDNWFDVVAKGTSSGECYLIRYCDDFVVCFQYKREAEIFYKKLQERFDKYGLKLAMEKTKILEFGRFATENRKRSGKGKPETFDFLGFTFYCSKDKNNKFFRCKVKTSKKKLRSKIKAMREWIKEHRTDPLKYILKYIFKMVNLKLQGHYRYYGVTDNIKEIRNYQHQTERLLFIWLNRRSQKRSYTSKTFNQGLLRTFPIKEPRIMVSLLRQ